MAFGNSKLGDGGSYQKWYTSPKNEVHAHIFQAVKRLDNNQTYLKDRFIDYAHMYTNRDIAGLSSKSYSEKSGMASDTLVHNVAKNLVDAATSKIATKRVKVMFLTSRGDPKLKKKAKLLNRFVAGQHSAAKLHKAAKLCFRDACIFGNGFLKIHDDGHKIITERIFPPEIIVDDEEAKYANPRQMFQHKEIDRAQVFALAERMGVSKKLRNELEDATLGRWDDEPVSQKFEIADCVSVIEAWRLPSYPGADDGRHVICTNTCVLLDECWERDEFPFAVFRWVEPVIGYWGQGIVEEIKEKQMEINYLEKKVQEEMNLGAARVFLPPGADIAQVQLSNEIGGIYEVTDPAAVKVFNTNMVAPETWAQIDREEQKMYQLTGISQLSAASMKPGGLDSGKALREYYDIESERFQAVAQLYEEAILDATRIMLKLAKEISERDDSSEYTILAKHKDGIEELKWSEVCIDEDKYLMDIYPTNFLPSTPAGKWQQVQEMLQAGFIERPEGMSLLDYPDVEAVTARLNAPYDIVEADMELILTKGEQAVPEPFYDLKLAANIAQRTYLRAIIDGYSEEKLEMIRNYLEEIKTLLQPPAPPPPPPGMMGPGGPGGPGAPPGMGPPPGAGGPPPMPGGPMGPPPEAPPM